MAPLASRRRTIRFISEFVLQLKIVSVRAAVRMVIHRSGNDFLKLAPQLVILWPKYRFVLRSIVMINSFVSPAAFKLVFTTTLPAPQHSLCHVKLTSKAPVTAAANSAH